ncbi:FecCD family ABC transporter permease [Corynebacterium guangdongense]|uniref:Iron complex transport system permease protein n=1 Tax=Corynebacterium guangdongense TaxID=1783348 RepID=A0ABU1ZV14_9CORY|nr:iron ABC transporter permease [Corynebacterium guangdongense]MDR7328625.1 iron complex transport system permease protein [Corynebacterium guangdongense]WJZ17202.1 putative siderophore transport system permease protein YfhA [Corynebacterium guangdongense]
MTLAGELAEARAGRRRHRAVVTLALLLALAALWGLHLSLGRVVYSPAEILAGLREGDFIIAQLRLPRVALATATGLAFGAAGCVFQTLLRNQLASPDIIGVSTSAAVAGVVGIVVLGLSQWQTSLLALALSLVTAAGMFALAHRSGFSATRLILVGLGVAAFGQSVITWTISIASAYDLPAATRWLTGSLNDASPTTVTPVVLAVVLLLPVALAFTHHLDVLRFGEDLARGLGVPVGFSRVVLLLTAVGLIAVATAAGGPIAFVAFLSGPIAARLAGVSTPPVLQSALVGAVLVAGADAVGQHLLPVAYPVGVLTGAVGAPYLLYLLHQKGRS